LLHSHCYISYIFIESCCSKKKLSFGTPVKTSYIVSYHSLSREETSRSSRWNRRRFGGAQGSRDCLKKQLVALLEIDLKKRLI